MKFELTAPYVPTGDQPKAIAQLVKSLNAGEHRQTLLGVTGSGKTFTMANIIQQLQRPTLIISHNKTLAAQLASEFREFFQKNAVQYFVSFYDYYQPESYLPRTDTYIEKTTALNEEIERMRHAATEAVLSRRDVIIVASVSCIYGLGSPIEYKSSAITITQHQDYPRNQLLNDLTNIRYERTDTDFKRGKFRIKGEIIEIFPMMSEYTGYRIRCFGDEIESIEEFHVITHESFNTLSSIDIYPATHYVLPDNNRKIILNQIEQDMQQEVAQMKTQGKDLEAHRLSQRVSYDLEMMREVGYVNGIENYSRYFDQRQPGQPSYTLIDYFPKDYLLFIDESHITLPQISGMYKGDRARKQTLVDYGFRLQAAVDNRPLQFEELTQRINQVVYVSATPGKYELEGSTTIAEQMIRPTGLLDPPIIVKPTTGQIPDLLQAIKQRVSEGERVLVTTLTKRMAEELAEFLQEQGIAVQYIHSEIDTLQRLEILRDLRMGVYDVLVGINLLREGLDLPEVSLVAILDADKEGFLRSSTSLIQLIGRAARHEHSTVYMYADVMTRSMKLAIDETNRRRTIQERYNKDHNITPHGVKRIIQSDRLSGQITTEQLTENINTEQLSREEKSWLLGDLEQQMEIAAKNLEFELAAKLRDTISQLKSKDIASTKK